jgi:hypothetical protein
MSGRRAFLLNIGMILGMPAVSGSSHDAEASARYVPEALPTTSTASNMPVFKIDGWSLDDGTRITDFAKSLIPSESSEEIWVRIGRSWQVAWR